jgi:NadR type nicotinamide-nucleotide adenylyltransferase
VTGTATPMRVVLIGPECTGKTWLAQRLARHVGAPWSGEYARVFVDTHPRPVEYADVDTIGRGQLRVEDAAIAQARDSGAAVVVHDTDLVSTVVYSRHYYDDCPSWIPPLAAGRLADLYLLHDIDVPWTEDGHMRVEPERREDLMARFRSTLAALAATVVSISGNWDERFDAAVTSVEQGFRSGTRIRAHRPTSS